MNKPNNIQTESYTDIMLEQMPVCVALYDAQTFCLQAANSLFFQSLDPPWRGNQQAIGRLPTAWLPRAEALGIMEIFYSVAETGTPYNSGTYMFPAFERGITYWNWTLNPVRDSDGRIVKLIQTLVEITDRVEAHQKTAEDHVSLLQAHRTMESDRKRLVVIEAVARSVRTSFDPRNISMAASKAILDTFQTRIVFIHTADPAQRALHLLHIYPYLNDSQRMSIAGYIPYTSPFLIARSYKQREPIVVADLVEAQAQGSIPRESPLIDSGAASFVCVPLWCGEQFEGTLSATFAEVIDPDGPEVQTLLGCSLHIAAALANARLHADIENERSRLRSILDQLPEGIIISEADTGNISYANAAAAAILGVSLDELIKTNVNQNTQAYASASGAGQFLLPWNFAIIRALSGETMSSQEMVMARPDGKKMTILSSSAPLRTRWSMITGAVIVFQDITAQKSLEQQKNEFLSFASHELRTPITAIQGYAEILLSQAESEKIPDQHFFRALSIINEQSETLSRLIDEMLDLTRIDNLQLKLHRARYDLVALVKNAIETQTSTTRKHELRLVQKGPGDADTMPASVDKNRFVQIVSNLISNAIKYSPNGGEIEIGIRYASAAQHEAILWVTDHGIGIAPAETPHIFKRFHRVQDVDPSISGLGIGLYLVKELVTLHGGRIWIESVEGRGSTFYVQLPLNIAR